MFGVKDPIPSGLHSCVVYKFTYAACNACYVDEMVGIFPHVERSIIIYSQSSEHCRAIVFMFWITPQLIFKLR